MQGLGINLKIYRNVRQQMTKPALTSALRQQALTYIKNKIY